MKSSTDKNKEWIKAISILFIIYSFIFSPAGAQKTLTILHTNDTHSTIMPLNPNLADTMLADRGGFLRRMNMIRQQRQQDPCCSSTAVTSRKARPTTACSKATWR